LELEGTWEEVAAHASELAGRRVRLIVLAENKSDVEKRAAALDQALMDAGLMVALPMGLDPDSYRAFRPVSVQGKPVSETLLEERR
jgi:hypothetical protein